MLELIRIFDQVVESGSFSAAGKVLNMAPSSVARNIDNLEFYVKTTLFKRSTRQLVLTEHGHYFYQHGLTLLQQADNLVAEMRGPQDEPEGQLRISSFESFGNLYLTPVITRFLSTYPKIQIELDLNNHVVDLNQDNTDLAIRIGTPKDSNFKARLLMENRCLLVATPRYLEQTPTIRTPEDLKAHNCLSINHGRQKTHWYFSRDNHTQKVNVKGSFTSRGGSPLLYAALESRGVLLMSDWIVTPYLKSEELVELLPHWQANYSERGSGQIYALYKESLYPKPHLRLFLDYLLKEIESGLSPKPT